MTRHQKALILMLVQVALALAVAAKLGWDRQIYPRVWARTFPVDPDDPFRGRYVRLRLAAVDRRSPGRSRGEYAVEGNHLIVRSTPGNEGLLLQDPLGLDGDSVVRSEPVALFIPEHIPDPSQLEAGSELWVEVTVPPTGLPRPIRLAVRPKQ